jgi:Bifunctional DNA primase/polymerase, N-terminal
MAAILTSSNTFRDWQPRYAERNIPTFPIEIGLDTKKPMVSNYCRFGLPASAEIARRYPEATAIGFMAGRRTGLTVLDVDTTDERVLADALDKHGRTPVIVRSGSGHHQAWFRHNGEGRHVRAFGPDTPIDILGGGFVVAPPSRGIKADYRFIQGGLDDLDRLPMLQNLKIETASPSPALDLSQGKSIIEGQRNDTLWRYCMEQAHHCDDLETLFDVARTRNEDCLPLLDDGEVVKIAKSAWGYTIAGQNRFGQTGARIRAAEVTSMAPSNPYAFALLEYLRVHNGPDRTFIVANALAETLGWTRERFVKARDCLEGSHLEMVRKYSKKNGPAWYRWRRLR